jgi:hypothetical protein
MCGVWVVYVYGKGEAVEDMVLGCAVRVVFWVVCVGELLSACVFRVDGGGFVDLYCDMDWDCVVVDCAWLVSGGSWLTAFTED